jgi:hypothetical protein
MVDAALLDRNQSDLVRAMSDEVARISGSEPTTGMGIYEKLGNPVSSMFYTNVPLLADGEEVLWHREKMDGIINKKLRAFEALTNFRVMFYDFQSCEGFGDILLAGGEVIVANQKRLSESQRSGTFAGGAARGTFAGSSGGSSYGESQTFGDVKLVDNGSVLFTYYQVADPHGLARLMRHAIESQARLGRKLDEKRKSGTQTSGASKSVLCIECDSSNPEGSKFCNKCGGKMDFSCHKCGQSNPRGASFCNSCGAELS